MNETINAKINASGFFLWTLLVSAVVPFLLDVLRKPSIAPLFCEHVGMLHNNLTRRRRVRSTVNLLDHIGKASLFRTLDNQTPTPFPPFSQEKK